jgi:hypothetical protein
MEKPCPKTEDGMMHFFSIPVDNETDKMIDDYFSSRPIKSRKLYMLPDIIYLVSVFDKENETINVCCFTEMSDAEKAIKEATEYLKLFPIFAGETTKKDEWNLYVDEIVEWRTNHPLMKYNQKIRYRDSDIYNYITIPLYEEMK